MGTVISKEKGNFFKQEFQWPVANNQIRREWTIKKINSQNNFQILEIGFGSGITIRQLAENLETGCITGIDQSNLLVKMVSNSNQELIDSGKMQLRLGNIPQLDCLEETFDVIFSNKIYYFWDNPAENLLKIRKLLKSSGKFILVFQPLWLKDATSIDSTIYQLQQQLLRAGFKAVEIEKKKTAPIDCIYIAGLKQKD